MSVGIRTASPRADAQHLRGVNEMRSPIRSASLVVALALVACGPVELTPTPAPPRRAAQETQRPAEGNLAHNGTRRPAGGGPSNDHLISRGLP